MNFRWIAGNLVPKDLRPVMICNIEGNVYCGTRHGDNIECIMHQTIIQGRHKLEIKSTLLVPVDEVKRWAPLES